MPWCYVAFSSRVTPRCCAPRSVCDTCALHCAVFHSQLNVLSVASDRQVSAKVVCEAPNTVPGVVFLVECDASVVCCGKGNNALVLY